MKITSISTHLVGIPYQTGAPTQKMGGQSWDRMAILFVKVETDEGLVGWGEGFGHACAPATKAAIDTMIAGHFIGRDPTDITGLMAEMMQKLHLFGRNGPVVYGLSAIDIALWDIAGKRAGLPLYQLLGGSPRRELAAYASLLRYTDPNVVSAICVRVAKEGYRYIKLHEIEVAPVKAARAAVGPDVEIMMDTNCPWSLSQALEMVRALAPYRLHWLEEPIWPPEDHSGLAQLRAAGAVIAAGENAGGLFDFRRVFEAGAVDIAQPSVTKIGGVTEMRKVIALAEAFGVKLVPHCAYFGSGYLASLHIAASLAHEVPFERLYLQLEASPLGSWLDAEDGKAPVPQAPGLGCDPDMAILVRYRAAPVVEVK